MRIRFGPFVADLDTRQLTRDGREVHLVPKAFELLVTLARERPKVLSKSALLERLWPDTFVSEGNLSNLIADIREALGDRASAPTFVRTAHGYGYAFCGDATTEPEAHDGPTDRAPCWLEWGTRRFRLSIGEHIIGRDPDAEIRLDESMVSRHTRGSSSQRCARGSKISAARMERFTLGPPSRCRSSSPTAMRSVSGRCYSPSTRARRRGQP